MEIYPHSSYEDCIKSIGADILSFEYFGHMSGQWMGLVRYEGQLRFVSGAYGCCSQCDDLEGQQLTLEERKQFGHQYVEPVSIEIMIKIANELDNSDAQGWVQDKIDVVMEEAIDWEE